MFMKVVELINYYTKFLINELKNMFAMGRNLII